MPIYVCSAATGRLTPVQKTEIARSITDIYHEVTGTARYFVRVMFQDVTLGNNYIAGRPAIPGAERPTSRRAKCCDE